MYSSRHPFLSERCRLGNSVIDGSYVVEGCLRIFVHLSLDDSLETSDRFLDRNIDALKAGKFLGYKGRLSQESLDLTSTPYGELVFLSQFFHTEDGYDVSIGKIDNAEIDFIATNADEKIYIQVTESMTGEDVRKRELAPLQKVRDNYEKIVLSLDPGIETSYEGIKSKKLIDWLLT